MKLHAIVRQFIVFDRSDGGIVRVCDDIESVGEPGDVIAVAHPHRRSGRHAVEQVISVVYDQRCTSEFAAGCLLYGTVEAVCHRLQAVADAQHRDWASVFAFQIQKCGVERRRIAIVHRKMAARENQSARFERLDVFGWLGAGINL